MRALGEEGDICLRVQIAPVSESEADELAQDLGEPWPTLRSEEAVSYAAAPVRMRVFLSTPDAHVPARVRAIIQAGRRELALVALGERTTPDVVDLWESRIPDQVLPGLAAQVLTAFTLRVDHNDCVAGQQADPRLTDRIIERSRAPFRGSNP